MLLAFFSVYDFVTNPVCGFFCFVLFFNAAVELVRQELCPGGSLPCQQGISDFQWRGKVAAISFSGGPQ